MRRRDQRQFAGGFVVLAGLVVFAPLLALLVPSYGLLLWAILLRQRWRRRYWVPIVGEVVLFGAMVAWVIAMRRYAYAVPLGVVVLVLRPRGDLPEPFTTAAEQLEFGEPAP